MELKGLIKKVLPLESGKTKDGKDWQKQLFVVSNNDGYEGKEAIFCFEIFGEEKVQNFNKFNKEGDNVEVSFNISTNEWNGKYFTALQSWKVFKADTSLQTPTPSAQSFVPTSNVVDDEKDSLPF
jgi:hypothetical protein